MDDPIFISGVIAIIGATLVAVSDMLLLGNPISGQEFSSRGLRVMLNVSPKRMLAGHTLGVLALPLAVGGVYQVYRGIEPAGTAYAVTIAAMMIYMLIAGAAAHACFAFLGGALQLKKLSGDNEAVEALVQQHKRLLVPLFGAFVAALVISSALFAFVVASHPTRYPSWMAIPNPFVLFLVFGFVARAMPAPIGGYVRPANGNLCFVLFFVVSTAVLVAT